MAAAEMETRDFGRPVEASEYSVLGPEALEALHVIEACIRSHHMALVDYTDESGARETLRVRPAFVRTNPSGHLVLWCMPAGLDEWRELRLDRLHGAKDTGEEFTPAWQQR